jgi:hypothetical protein
MELIFRYALHLVLFTLLTYSIGKIIRRLLKIKHFFFADTFYSLLLGSIILSTGYAIWFTMGKTVHSCFILLGGFFFYFRNRQPHNPIDTANQSTLQRWKFVGVVAVVLLGLYAWEAMWVFKSGQYPYIMPFKDIGFYALVSDFLTTTGCENALKYWNLIDEATYKHLQLYHYFTLWNTNLTTKLFGGCLLTIILWSLLII